MAVPCVAASRLNSSYLRSCWNGTRLAPDESLRMTQVFALAALSARQKQPRVIFALAALGIIDSLIAGSMTPTEAIRTFFHAKNCRYVRSKLRDKRADEVMGRGVQLADLFNVMPVEEAHREFQHELAAMKSLCHELLQAERVAV